MKNANIEVELNAKFMLSLIRILIGDFNFYLKLKKT